MKRPPRIPSIPLESALELVAPSKPGTGRPSEHSLPAFHSNVYARLLAAKPKMDLLTRRVYPSSMLTRIGVNADHELDAVSSMSRVVGARLWVSSSPGIKQLPKEARGRLVSKNPAMASLRPAPTYRPKHALLADLELSLDLYKRFLPDETKSVVCFTKPGYSGNDLTLDITGALEIMELDVPDVIRHGKHGLYLAGNILKFLYIYGPEKH